MTFNLFLLWKTLKIEWVRTEETSLFYDNRIQSKTFKFLKLASLFTCITTSLAKEVLYLIGMHFGSKKSKPNPQYKFLCIYYGLRNTLTSKPTIEKVSQKYISSYVYKLHDECCKFKKIYLR